MSKILVAYFSAGGITAKAAKELAAAEGADLYEILPEEPYLAADLDYTNKNSRSSREMGDLDCRPAVAGRVRDMAAYDVVFLGFPIWWGREPSVVDTFLESYDFTGKKLVPFCTSGGNGVEGAVRRIRALLGNGVRVDEGRRLGGQLSPEDLKLWAEGTIQ